MPDYYVNKNRQDSRNGNNNEVHVDNCSTNPHPSNLIYLGFFSNCREAVQAARSPYPTTADGCYYCTRECHKG